MKPGENPFFYVTDLDALKAEERAAYDEFWAGRTAGERLAEIFRLNRAKWGDDVFDRGVDKSKIEVIDMVTGERRVIWNSNKLK
jgi:hypothetical protein